jgi:hypothetical protein
MSLGECAVVLVKLCTYYSVSPRHWYPTVHCAETINISTVNEMAY